MLVSVYTVNITNYQSYINTGTTFTVPYNSCYLAKDPTARSEMCISFQPIPLNSFNELYHKAVRLILFIFASNYNAFQYGQSTNMITDVETKLLLSFGKVI